MEKQLTSNQISRIVIITSLGLKISVLPAFMASVAGNDFWITAAGVFIMEIFTFLFVLKIAEKVPGKTFFKIIEENLGKWVMKIIQIIFVLFFLFKTVLSIYESGLFVKYAIYEDFNEIIFLFIFSLFLLFFVRSNLRTIGRAAEIMIFIAVSASIISLMVSVLEIDPTEILPVMTKGVKPLISCAGKSSFWFGDYLIFLLMMGNVKFEKNSVRRTVVSYVMMSVILVLFFITFACLFKNTMNVHMTAVSDVSHYIPRFSDFRMDWVSDILWIFVCFFSSGVWFFCFKWSFDELFDIKSNSLIVPVVFCICVIVFIYFLKIPVTRYVEFLSDYGWVIAAIMSQLPVMFFVCFKIGKRRKYYANVLKE